MPIVGFIESMEQMMTDTAFKIDKNIPITTGPRSRKYPVSDLDVGDSFFVAGAGAQKFGGIFAPHKPKKFCVRTVVENNVRGTRVWRVS